MLGDKVKCIKREERDAIRLLVCQRYIPLLVQYKTQRQLQFLNFTYDQAPFHTNLVNTSINTKYVSERLTSLLQPTYVSWMKALIVAYLNKWNHWLVNAEKAYTPAGNRKSPGYGRVINWISETWQDLDHNLTARLFDHCGITTTNVADYSN